MTAWNRWFASAASPPLLSSNGSPSTEIGARGRAKRICVMRRSTSRLTNASYLTVISGPPRSKSFDFAGLEKSAKRRGAPSNWMAIRRFGFASTAPITRSTASLGRRGAPPAPPSWMTTPIGCFAFLKTSPNSIGDESGLAPTIFLICKES